MNHLDSIAPTPTNTEANLTDTEAVQALAALAQLSRLQVFRWLVVAGPAGGTPGAMAQDLGVSATALSFHLKELVHAGLVTQERQGRNLIYRPQLVAMQQLLSFLTANCCQGTDSANAQAAACTQAVTGVGCC